MRSIVQMGVFIVQAICGLKGNLVSGVGKLLPSSPHPHNQHTPDGRSPLIETGNESKATTAYFSGLSYPQPGVCDLGLLRPSFPTSINQHTPDGRSLKTGEALLGCCFVAQVFSSSRVMYDISV
jgi:hypothetical protein